MGNDSLQRNLRWRATGMLRELDRFGFTGDGREAGMTNNCHWWLITSSGWPFVLAVLSQMAYLVANIALNSTRSSIVGVGVTVVVVVESSSVVKLSFVIT
ncbi:hypothetical protein Tco_0645965 [Tanacetum coccineum]